MKRPTLPQIYTTAILAAAIIVGLVAAWQWPHVPGEHDLWLIPGLAFLIIAAGRFPFKVSPQGDATLVTVPMFMAILLLHPAEAIFVAVAGTAISETMIKAPAKAWIFNVSVNGLVAGLAGIVFWGLRPETGGFFDPNTVMAAVTAGLVDITTGMALLFGIITIVKGKEFWRRWRATWAFEVVLDGSQITIGLIGAILVSTAAWMLLVLAVPVIVAYYAFSRSVREVLQKTELAENLDNNLKELKEMQSQLIQSAKLATMGTMSASIAHDINNPLTIITARADLLLARLARSDNLNLEKLREDIEDMREMSIRITTIIQQMLSFSRRAEDLSDVNLSRLMDESIPLLERKFQKKNISLVKEFKDKPRVHVVPGQLQQVFMNLVGNAIDAIPEHGTITIGCRVEDDMAVGYVKDTGSGMPQKVIDTIFEPFFTTKEDGMGTGLGLFICHKIVTDHDGNLAVESKEGAGTTFYVKLPIAVGEEKASSSELEEMSDEEKLLTKMALIESDANPQQEQNGERSELDDERKLEKAVTVENEGAEKSKASAKEESDALDAALAE